MADAPSMHDLSEIIQAYNQVTEKLQHSHEKLKAEVVRLRRDLASADAQLQRARRLSALGEMAAGIAHEIRNPLGGIQLYAQLVEQDLTAPEPDVEQALDATRKISDAVRGLDAIVGDVLSFARQIQPRHDWVEAGSLFDQVIESHRPAIEKTQVQVVVDAADVMLFVDASLMQQALLNLVRNAVEAMEGREQRQLTLRAWVEEDWVGLSVEDTGPGIEEDVVDRLFNPFFTTRSTGTGLGLAIVHRLIDAHQGAITVHRKPSDSGALFKMTLPLTVKETPSAELPQEVVGAVL